MMNINRTLLLGLLILTCVVISAEDVLAQGKVNPLDFGYRYPRIGAEIGLSSVWQNGTYVAGCGTFLEGAKINPLIAIAYDIPVARIFRFEALAGYQSRNLSSSYNSRENLAFRTSEGTSRFIDVDFENVGAANFSYIFVQPSLKWGIIPQLYVGGGVGVNLLLSASTQYTKNIVTRTVNFDDLGLSEIYYSPEESSDPYSKVFEEVDRTDANGVGFDGLLYVGTEFKANEDLVIGPRIQLTIPILPVLTDPEELTTSSLQFLLGIRYNL